MPLKHILGFILIGIIGIPVLVIVVLSMLESDRDDWITCGQVAIGFGVASCVIGIIGLIGWLFTS